MEMHNRRLKSFVACCAGLMLLAQLVLTAGHVHLVGQHSVGAVSQKVAWPRFLQDPPPKPFRGDDDRCQLCWAQLATASALIPPAITLSLPLPVPAPRSAPILHSVRGIAAVHAFRPRAPPPMVSAERRGA